MRAGTLIFLALFGAFVLHDRLPHASGHRLRAACASACRATPLRAESAATSSRVRELQSELDRLERRGRDLERSLQSVTGSARTLRELVAKHGDAAVRAELVEIEAGRDRLRELRDRTEIARVAVAARLQLARAGLLEEPRDERSSPVDALGEPAHVIAVSRAR